VPGFTDNGRHGLPWIGNNKFVAVLFYSRNGSPRMRAGGLMAKGESTKILWSVAGGRDDPLVIHGSESDSGKSFTQKVDGIGNGQYPSIPVVPSAGCWTLAESVAGQHVGSITVPVAPAINQ
jgi:hypothetical protein